MTVPQPQPTYGAQAPQNTMGLVSMILGIASIPLAFCCGAGLLFGVVGAVLGYMGKQKAAQGQATNGGQANAGFICGIVGVAISVLWFVIGIALNISLMPFTNSHL